MTTPAKTAQVNEGMSGDELPIHFFTIVLNGEPFIRYHLDVLKKLPFRWHWHVVEGVASLSHDTAWSVAAGGRVDASIHDRGRSNDGTSAYLDEMVRAAPGQVTIYRKPLDQFWDGKKEMVQAPLANISEPCLLWQIDADELWTATQIVAVRNKFLAEPARSAAYFWCDYFVGPRALISTRYNYAQNPDQEWLRVWRFQPGDRWAAHEPPTLTRAKPGSLLNKRVDIAKIAPLMHDETEAMGAIFQHFAYVTEPQLRFKDTYYGYKDAVAKWHGLLAAVDSGKSVLLRDYFSWVNDDTLVDSTERCGVMPIAYLDGDKWCFSTEEPKRGVRASSPRIVIDGVFFQHSQVSGIARLWRALLTEWAKTSFAEQLVILDRGGTAPRLPGLRYQSVKRWDQARTGEDSLMLQHMCDSENAALFVSTYYTAPISTPSLFVALDMIPEALGMPMEEQVWREKHHAIRQAICNVCISESTKRDLVKCFPEAGPTKAILIGVEDTFYVETPEKVAAFRAAHNLTKPYFLLVGERMGFHGYKNAQLFFKAFSGWTKRDQYDVFCVGGGDRVETALLRMAPDARAHRALLDDAQLRAAYTGAVALIYPSRYEGFGLPVAEAMACGCPVITCPGSSLGEVGADAPIYIQPDDIAAMRAALDQVLGEAKRADMIARGLKQAAVLNWPAAAARYADALCEARDAAMAGAAKTPAPTWAMLRQEQKFLQKRIPPVHDGESVLIRIIWKPLFIAREVVLKTCPPSLNAELRKVWRRLYALRMAADT